MQPIDKSQSDRIPVTNPPPHEHGKLPHLLAESPEKREQLMAALSSITRHLYDEYKETFIASLSPFNQAIYHEAQKIPYAQKDWYRDAHDIVVTWSLAVIVREENMRAQASGSRELLPEWLVTAALLHDRGYGILASQLDTTGHAYHGRTGAHWENVDTRVLHSLLSRKFSEGLLMGGDWKTLFPNATLPAVNHVPGFGPLSDRELFLTIVEKHDHPLIGKLDQLPELGRHHFDADSLYSISLSSFVKDWLSYLSDSGKIARWRELGLIDAQTFSSETLLGIRLARYYPGSAALPSDWDSAHHPLRPEAAKGAEGGICIEPFSQTAHTLTDDSFRSLAACCRALNLSDTIEDFLPWFKVNLAAQFERLEILVNGKRPI